jgi:hypothetical protein
MKRLLFSALMMVCSVSWAGWEYTERSNEAFFMLTSLRYGEMVHSYKCGC